MPSTYVQLARAGDILTILPLLWADANKGERPRLMVQRDYASLLDGVSYVEPVIFDGGPHEIARAVKVAQAHGGQVICTQVNGPKEEVAEYVYGPAGRKNAKTTSFQKEQWAVAGRLAEWDNGYPLVFDKRDAKVEEALVKEHVKAKRFVLVHADGISSPFPYRDLLLELLKYCGMAVVNLADVKAPRLFDLLGLYERAHCLFAIDSAPLHLANAAPELPVFALVNDKPTPWNGSSWRPQHEWYCRYSDFPFRAASMLEALRGRKDYKRPPLVHVCNGVLENPQTVLGDWRLTPITQGMVTRLGPAGDPKIPYLRDLVRMGIQRAGRDGWVCLTRPDTRIAKGATAELKQHEACYAYRVTEKAGAREFTPIHDLFCAKADWWRNHLGELPDFLLGRDYHWSHCLWAMFQAAGAVDVTGLATRAASEPKTTPSTSTAFNHEKARQYALERKLTSRFPKVIDQIETLPLSGLHPFAYNPSIIDDNGFRLVAYRYHEKPTNIETKLAIAQLDDAGAAAGRRTLPIEGRSIEDPKLWRNGSGETLISFVVSTVPVRPLASVVKVGRLAGGSLIDVDQGPFPGNDGSTMQKNWVYWDAGGLSAMLYQCHPTHVVYCGERFETPGPRWDYGPIKGGTRPVDVGDHWLRFFHSTTDNEMLSPWRRRYFMGAYLMEKQPPFKVVRVSRRPILYGSEIDGLKVKDRPPHWKSGVVFPGGILERPGHWVVALGVNDSQCVLAKVTEKDLHL